MKKHLLLIGSLALVITLGVSFLQKNQIVESKEEPSNRSALQQDSIRYAEYSPELFSNLSDQRRILFFKANWCGTCTTADQDISTHTSLLPSDITILKVSFDQENELRTRYGVTNQHTFVQVDGHGTLVNIWNGGGVEQLLEEIS